MYAKAFVDDYQPRLARLLGLPDDATDLDVHAYIKQGIPLDQAASLQRQMAIDLRWLHFSSSMKNEIPFWSRATPLVIEAIESIRKKNPAQSQPQPPGK